MRFSRQDSEIYLSDSGDVSRGPRFVIVGIRVRTTMRARILIAAVAFSSPTYACGQAGAEPPADSAAIHGLLGEYAKAVDMLISSYSRRSGSFPRCLIHLSIGRGTWLRCHRAACFPEGNGRNVSARDLELHNVILCEWRLRVVRFHWDFHVTMRKDGSAVTTHGVETRLPKRRGKVAPHPVHYSEDRQSARETCRGADRKGTGGRVTGREPMP